MKATDAEIKYLKQNIENVQHAINKNTQELGVLFSLLERVSEDECHKTKRGLKGPAATLLDRPSGVRPDDGTSD